MISEDRVMKATERSGALGGYVIICLGLLLAAFWIAGEIDGFGAVIGLAMLSVGLALFWRGWLPREDAESKQQTSGKD